MKFRGVLLALPIIILLIISSSAQPPGTEWHTFSSALEEFELQSPEPMLPKRSGNDLLKPLELRGYKLLHGGNYYFAFSSFPKPMSGLSPRYPRSDLVRAFVNIYSQTPITADIGPFDTEKYAFQDEDGFHHMVLIVRGETRHYYFQTVSTIANHPDAVRFHKSIRLAGNLSPGDPLEIKKSADANSPSTVVVNLVSGMTSSNKPVGSGSGDGQTPVVKPPSTTPTPAASSDKKSPKVGILTILAKPRANYSDFGRYYEIEGKVTVRATFQSDGTIGTVTVLNKLPFGLTAMAVAAVRGIQFNPATREGIPYTVSKSVEYNFKIL